MYSFPRLVERLFCGYYVTDPQIFTYKDGLNKSQTFLVKAGVNLRHASGGAAVEINDPLFACLHFSSTHSVTATTDSQPGAHRPAKVALTFTDWLSGGFGRGDLSESSHITLHPDLRDATPSLLVPLNQVQTVLHPCPTTFREQTSVHNVLNERLHGAQRSFLCFMMD